MTDRVLKLLEYDKIIGMVADHALSETGRERILSLAPETKYEAVERALTETDEASSLIAYHPGFPIVSFDDISSAVKRLAAQSALSCGELMRVCGVMRAAKRAAETIDREHAPLLFPLTEWLWWDDVQIRNIDSSIISDTEVADAASPKLRTIRRSMAREHDAIRDKLNGLIRGENKFLQENLITVRSGRYVVPVKAEYRGSIAGLVHDQSGSGQTLFIEPMSVVESNNKLKVLESEEKAEIERILRELSLALSPYASQLNDDLKTLTHLDCVFAKAMYSKKIRGVLPKLNREGITDLKEGRHPLIPRDKVVSVSVAFGESYKALVITGPNTGGKTVCLKLIGLLQLMAQSGIFVPCDNGTRMTVYRDVFVDIGDEQSIEQSLSTFSSHMKNTTDIVEHADSETLVLLDELGAGTDPAEGAALATAILEELMYREVPLVATTHYSEIKAFAMSYSYFENAGMEFDADTLSPTYRLFIGIPGMSNAFLISERLGLPHDIIERAKSHISDERARFEQVLSEAEKERSAAQNRSIELAALEKKLQAREQEADEYLARAREEAEKYLAKSREEAKKLVREANAEVEELISELKAAKSAGVVDDRLVTDASHRARTGIGRLNEKHDRPAKREKVKKPVKSSELLLGQTVYIPRLKVTATLLSLPDKNGDLEVQAGMMKLKTNLCELEEAIEKKERRGGGSVSIAKAPVSLSVNVQGMVLEEALLEVDQYLSTCVMQSLTEVMIIHGVGQGVLMNGIRRHLRSHPSVASFRPGRYGEGEAGVTVVTLK